MRKQELIHLHALCLLLRERLDERTTIPPDAFTGYETVSIDPTAVHRRKAEHRAAVIELLDGLATALSERDADGEPVDPSRRIDQRDD